MAFTSKSKLREVLADPRAAAIIEEYKPGFAENPALGPCMGMRIGTLLTFPQAGIEPEDQSKIIARLEALE